MRLIPISFEQEKQVTSRQVDHNRNIYDETVIKQSN